MTCSLIGRDALLFILLEIRNFVVGYRLLFLPISKGNLLTNMPSELKMQKDLKFS